MALPLPNFQELGRDIKNRLDTLETDVSTKISTADANATFLPIKGKAESAKIADSATTADKLTTSSNFSISGGATAAGVAYNGTADVQLVVTSIDGTKVTGSVPSATKATQDAAGNVIATTYAKQSQLPTVMGAASAAAAGSSGLVPQPAAGSNTKFLRGDATQQTVTDPTVTQSSTTIDGSLPILIKNSTTSTAETGPVKYATTVTVNPSTSTITATNFVGTASKTIADKSGNDITTTYAKQADLTSSTGRINSIENTTINLTGDVTGSATIGTAGSASITATIANSGVTAGTYGPTSNKTLGYGDTFTVPSVTVNAKGQTTAGATRTFTLPAAQDLSDYAKTADLPTTMVGATGSAGGKSGLVPASTAGDQNKVLSAGGTWVEQSTQQQVDWNAASGVTSIANKPTLGALAAKNSVAYSEVTGTPDLSVYQTVSDFNAFKIANDTALDSKANKSDVYTKTEVDSKLTSVYTYKGSVANEAALPTTGQTVGDVYNVEDTGMNVAWTANGWDKLGSVVDLSPYAKTADVYSKTVADSTFLTQSNAALTYATVTTINSVTNRVSTLEGKAVDMKGATSSAAGAAGFVPQPIAGDQAKFLRGDGKWAETPNATYTGGTGITVSGNTITNAGVRSVTAGAAANQISVNTNGTTSTITVNNVANATAADSATKATQDSAGQQIDTTYIKGLAVSGKAITYTKGDDTTGTITTQDTTYTNMIGATASAAGKNGLVPAPAAGEQVKFLRGDGTWVVPTDTKYSVMGSATASTGGVSGLVPASAAGDQLKFLRADGTWVVPTDTKYTAGTGIALDGTTFSNAGVRSVTAGASANQISVNTGGTTSTITVNNVANATAATKATQDSAGQQINKTYIKDLSVSGTTITFTRGDDTTGTITTQDTDTKYTAGAGIGITGTTISNAGVRAVKAGTNANQIVVDTNGTSNTITVNNVANAAAASKLATARNVTLAGDVTGSTTFDGSADVTITATVADDSHNHIIANVDGLQGALDAKAPLASPALTGTPTAPTASVATNNTQIATTAFVQAAINEKIAASDAMIYKGTIGNAASGATIAALPATHSVGWTYKVVTAGTYAGKVCEVGDMIICLTAGTVATDSDWSVVQSNIDGAVTGPASSVDAHVATFNGTTGKVIKDSGFTIGTSVPADAKFTDTTYTAGTGIDISGTTISNAGVRSVTAGAAANQISVNTNGTNTTITVNNVAKATAADSATKATQDSAGQQIDTTYIKGLAVSGQTITYTKGDGTTGSFNTQDTTYGSMTGATASTAGSTGLVPAPTAGAQDKYLKGDGTWGTPTDTKYSAGAGIDLSGTTFSNSGVRSIAAGSSANQLVVDTNGTSATITINNVANATNASKATQLTTARTIDGVSFNGTANIVHYGSCSTAAATVEKAVTCTGFTLATGARIIVKFTVTNTAKNPTLNVNSTGATPIYYRGAAISASYLAANRTYQFVYNGTQYELVGDIDTNTDTKVTQTLTTTNAEYSILGMADAAATANKTNTTRFSTGITMNPSTNTITASVFKGSLDGSYLTGTIDGGELT